MAKTIQIEWLREPEEHTYPAALEYMSLVVSLDSARETERKLRLAPVTTFKAKDIFRASGLSLLGVSNRHVRKDQKKIKKGVPLSPILLVRTTIGRLVIADGYHRTCAIYSFDEDAVIRCKIV